MKKWRIRKLNEVYDVRDGTHDSPKYQTEGYALITSKNLKSHGLNFEKVKYISEEDYKKINERSAVHKGDVLLAMIGTIGNPIVVEIEPDFAIKNVALIKVPEDQNSYFLKYYLESEYVKSKMQDEAKGTTQRFVSLGYLRNFPIALPLLAEQKRIVAILDEAFEGIDGAIANTEKNLANARELFESYLNTLFSSKGDGWTETTIGKVCKLSQGLAINKKTKYLLVPYSSLPLLRIKDLRDGTAEQFVVEEGYPANCLVDVDDIIYTRTGNSLGLVFTGRRGVLHNNSFKIVPDSSLSRRYLFWWLQNPSFKETIMDLASRAAQPDITHKLFNLRPISFPAIAVQEESVEKIELLSEETQRLKAIYQQKIAALNELKQSILQKAFSGELTADTAAQTSNAAQEVAAA